MAIDKSIRLPRDFRDEYRRNLFLRLAGSLVLLTLSGVLCTFLDFSGIRYPAMGVVMVLACGFVLACLLFRLHAILFKKSWSGVITDIEAKYKIKTREKKVGKKFVITLTIDCGKPVPIQFELIHEDMHGVNKYYVEAPYKVGDTVVYLRGMKYPLRYGVEAEGKFDVCFVCPYCGEINKAERDQCYHCGKTLVK
ncbi:MAG: hypothetical protein ACI4V1_06760 [Eubacteriales bacterium]